MMTESMVTLPPSTVRIRTLTRKPFLADLTVVPWSVIEQFDDVDDALDTWEKLFKEVVNTHAPLRERRVKRPRQLGWLTEEITEAMDKRDSLKQSRDFPNYKLWRNMVVRMLKEAKADYYINLIEENRHDTIALWAALREISTRSTTTSVMPNAIKSEMLKHPIPATLPMLLKGHCIAFKYYADGIHYGLTPPG